jgi:predicted nuclease of restriction endonuclease-like (RecB) superfamily
MGKTGLNMASLELLLGINDPPKRAFYEIECIKGAWSVRELKKQINSLYFKRSGLSKNPEKPAKLVQQKQNCKKQLILLKIFMLLNFLIYL